MSTTVNTCRWQQSMQLKNQESEVVLSLLVPVPLLISVARLSLGGKGLLAVSPTHYRWLGGWDCYESSLMEFMLPCSRKRK